MCNACGFSCCGSDEFEGCGCDHCDEPECWSKARLGVDADREPAALGRCCRCQQADANVLHMLEIKSPERDGRGWGCMVCGLPPEGAIVVFCEPCAQHFEHDREAAAQWFETPTICLGFPQDNRRQQVEKKQMEPHDHDLTKHPKRQGAGQPPGVDRPGLPPEQPSNLFELLWYCRHWEADIYVRHQVEGVWGSHPLAQMPSHAWASYVWRWLEDGQIPLRLLRDDEAAPC